MTRLLLSALVIAVAARADFDAGRWPLRRPLIIPQAGPVGSLPVDIQLYKGSRSRLEDLRVLRDTIETPYIIRRLTGSEEIRELSPRVLNTSIVPGVGLQATLDLVSHPVHNRLRIETAEHNFKQRVRIETSDDGRQWAMVRDDGYIFDFLQDATQFSSLSVDYRTSNRRFVRLTILGWNTPGFLKSAWLTYSKETPGTRDALSTLTPTVQQDAATKTTFLTGDIGFDGLPYDRVQVSADPGMFYRMVEVSISSNSKDWMIVGQGVISRTADHEGLTITFPEQWSRYIRLAISNEDNPPVTIRQMILSADRRILLFPAGDAGSFWLYYGREDSRQPTYDFVQTIARHVEAVPVGAGPEQPNPNYHAPIPPDKPWSDRHPYVLYAVLIAAVLGMGFIAVRMLLKVKPPPGPA